MCHATQRGFVRPILLVLPLLLILVAVKALTAYGDRSSTDDSDAALAVRKLGFVGPSVTKRHDCFASANFCGTCRDVGFDVVATNPAGDQVALLACCNPQRGCALRAYW